jgi:hypothetical protein
MVLQKTRRQGAGFLVVIYLIIAMSPLASFARQYIPLSAGLSKSDVNVCHCCCSTNLRANRSCCCRQKSGREVEREASPGCRKNKLQPTSTKILCNCSGGCDENVAVVNLSESYTLPFAFDTGPNRVVVTAPLHSSPRFMPVRFNEPPTPPPLILPFC